MKAWRALKNTLGTRPASASNGTGSPEILKTSHDFWLALCHQGGLQPTKLKSDEASYDHELVVELNSRMFPGTDVKDFERNLIKPNPPPPEDFLNAFFTVLKPFSQMLTDILKMFEQASAKRSDSSLKLEINYSKLSDSVALTLEEFREISSTLTRLLRPVTIRAWTPDQLWALDKTVSDHSIMDRISLADGPNTRRISNWPNTPWPPVVENFPGYYRTGMQDLDSWVVECEHLIIAMAEIARRPQLSREEESTLFEPEVPSISPGHLHDWIPGFSYSLASALDSLSDLHSAGKQDKADQLAAKIRRAFPDSERTMREEWSEAFSDLLNLPVWKRRHEVYAVWVGARIAKALEHLDWTWLPDGDRLSFPFSGADLALLRSDTELIEFWTEKQSLLDKPGRGRKKAIQPDYRLMVKPTHSREATRLVVECKQHERSSSGNFSAALQDYADGCPDAQIVLVNYGPISDSVRKAVDDGVVGRCTTIGHFRPDQPFALKIFNDKFGEVFPKGPSRAEPPSSNNIGPFAASVCLTWPNGSHTDLDLHVIARAPATDTVKFRVGLGASGNPDQEPWVHWPKDVRSPGGEEILSFSKLLSLNYDLYVHLFTEERTLFPAKGVQVRVMISDVTLVVLTPTAIPGARWWHVGTLRGQDRTFLPGSTLHRDRPTHFANS